MDAIITHNTNTSIPKEYTCPDVSVNWLDVITNVVKNERDNFPTITARHDYSLQKALQFYYVRLLELCLYYEQPRPIRFHQLSAVDSLFERITNGYAEETYYNIFITEDSSILPLLRIARAEHNVRLPSPGIDDEEELTEVAESIVDITALNELKFFRVTPNTIVVYAPAISFGLFQGLALSAFKFFGIALSTALNKALIQSTTKELIVLAEMLYRKNIVNSLYAAKETNIERTFSAIKQFEISQYESQISNQQHYVKQYEEEFRRQLDILLDLQMKDFYARHNPTCYEDFQALIKTSPHVYDVKRSNFATGGITMRFLTPCLNYGTADAQLLYDKSSRVNSNLSFKELFKRVFLDNTLFLWFAADIRVSLFSRRFEIDESTQRTVGYSNPHLHHYNCWGDSSSRIIEALEKKDYTTFFYALLSAVNNFNFRDGIVTNWFIDNLQEAEVANQPMFTRTTEPKNFLTITDCLKEIVNT